MRKETKETKVIMDFTPVADEKIEVDNPMLNLLGWAGFTGNQTATVRSHGFDELDDMSNDVLDEYDIKELAVAVSKLPASQRVTFGIAKTKRLIGMMHWVHDHARVSLNPIVLDSTTQAHIRHLWTAALERANSRKFAAKQSKPMSIAADPGELKNYKLYHE